MAKQKINSTQLALSKTVDTNGWTVYDYGLYKEYSKLFTGEIAANIAVDGYANLVNAVALPVGLSSLSGYFLTTSLGVRYSGYFTFMQEASGSTYPELSTTFKCGIYNAGTTAAAPGKWSVTARIIG